MSSNINLATPALIEAKNLSFSFNQAGKELPILNQLNMQAYAGESLAIIGPSGAGKSSLLALLAGLEEPTGGEVLWQGEPFSRLTVSQRAAKRLGFLSLVFQSFQLLPELTALENTLLPLELNNKLTSKQAEETAKYWLAEVGLSNRLAHRPHQLSGGEQQRVALARAFATNPKLLLADEPTGNLDTTSSNKIAELLFELANSSQITPSPKALILVTHDEGLAKECSRQLKLVDGKLIEVSL